MDLEDAYAHYIDAQEEEFLDRQRAKGYRRAREERNAAKSKSAKGVRPVRRGRSLKGTEHNPFEVKEDSNEA